MPLVCATKVLQWLISSWLNSCFCEEEDAPGTRGKQKTGSVVAFHGQPVLGMFGAWCCLKPVTGFSSRLLGTFKVVYRHIRCVLTGKMPSECLSYTISFVVRKMTSMSNAAVLRYLVLHRHQVSRVTREVMDRSFFSINTRIFYSLFTSQR